MIGGSERYYSTDPTGGASAWKATASLSASYAVIASLACNTLKLCVGVGYGNAGAGLATGSSTPDDGADAGRDSLIGSDPPAQGAGLVDWRRLPGAQLLRGGRRRLQRVHDIDAGARRLERGQAAEEGSQATISQVACNAKICVEVDNRGTVTYGVVKARRRRRPRRRPPPPRRSTAPTTDEDVDRHDDDQDVDAGPVDATERRAAADTR